MIDIVLVGSENPGNIGATARVMKNFGFGRLVLVEPVASRDANEAQARAMNAKDVLSKAKIVKKSYLKRYDYLIATSARMGTDYHIMRAPLFPWQLAQRLADKRFRSKRLGIMFGRESSGLTNEEIEMCDFVVTIPCSKRYGVLNLSQSIGIILYEIFKAQQDGVEKNSIVSHITFAGKKEKEQLLKTIFSALDKMEFSTHHKRETQKKLWRRFVGKSFLTVREAYSMHGFFRKIR